MYMHPSKIAVLIPARKGSKRVVNKNLKMFAGKPLLKWTFDEVLKVKQLTNIFFTTNYLPKELGFKVPDGITWISRPKELCKDESKAFGYINHFFERYPKFEVVILLQVTSPLRTSTDIKLALGKYLNHRKSGLVSVFRLPTKNKIYNVKGSNIYACVDYDVNKAIPVFYRNSAIYIFTQKHFKRTNKIFGTHEALMYEMPMARSIDIDTIQDFKYAERMLKYKSGGSLDGMDDCIDFNNIDSIDDIDEYITSEIKWLP